ncbi:hypothetical protein EJ110_NYTH02187, partial [Nymphaea thermarum]
INSNLFGHRGDPTQTATFSSKDPSQGWKIGSGFRLDRPINRLQFPTRSAPPERRRHRRKLIEEGAEDGREMEKRFSLIQTLAAAGVFSAVSFWYGFMFGRESARKELGGLIERLRSGKPSPDVPDS